MYERLYAKGELIDAQEADYESWADTTDIVTRSPIVFAPEAEANLVLSLCSDGLHRPAIDIDYPAEIVEAFGEKTLVVKRSSFWGDRVLHGLSLTEFGTDVVLVPSSTEGHFHLYGDKAMTWRGYQNFLRDLGFLGSGYLSASLERGFTALRKPGVKKEVR